MEISKALRQLQKENIIGQWALSGKDLSGLTLLTDPKPELTQKDLDDAYFRCKKQDKKKQVDNIIQSHCHKNMAYNLNVYDASPESWQNFMEADLALSKGWITEPLNWTKADSQTIGLNHSDILSIMELLAKRKLACYDRAKSLKAEIDATTTMEELDAIDINTAWPE